MNFLSVSRSVPGEFEIAFHPLLYNQRSFLDASNAMPQLHFYLLNRDSSQVLGHIAFSREENEVLSPWKAPFGGFEVADNLESSHFLFFATEVGRLLKEDGIRFVKIQMAPGVYLPNLPMVADNLLTLGFSEKRRLVHHVLEVNDQPFETQITGMEQRKLKKARSLDCKFGFESRERFGAIYNFIRQHRESKGHALSMDWELLRDALKKHEGQYLFCGVRLEAKLIAAAIMVRVSKDVLYYFIPGHDAEFNHLSPMVFLLGELYRWCQNEGLRFIDLGTSYWAGKENESLVKFKERLGGKVSESRIFRKTLSS